MAVNQRGKQQAHDPPAVIPSDHLSAPARVEPTLVDQFLVETTSAALVLRAMEPGSEKVLASSAQSSLYDERLELVWFYSGDKLWVLDLRAPDSSPVVIAEHVSQYSELHVARTPGRLLEPADSCDTVPVLRLNWDKNPAFEAWYASPPTLSREGRSWLSAELDRPERVVKEQQVFASTDPGIALPEALMKCDAPTACGATLPFAKRDWELVLVGAGLGADCWHYACLLRNMTTGAFATPPEPKQWGPASESAPGQCGRYLFNQDGSAFLLGNLLCHTDHPCQKLEGEALGWRVPGVIVGAPE
jgi:hypothetical protein